MSKVDEGEIVEEEESGEEDDMGKYMIESDEEEDKSEDKSEEKKTEEQKPVQSLREVRYIDFA